ncbi:ScbR family autoregulator-binding transcription factor [Streptomyces zhihengii]|uniref:TetR/AcrR family transcriptional regulator n=1 Tax=Streptomyces zhihengii TaxID=1818004 RepID=A0ABS2UMD9_9ACTN|nr:ScbR family autoregulator-binding transcription factor [Streptomyces zhihengii]MBM9618684.1 TetR/AcrR family transcriptional regulator [Streptomyces zhihengii]
MVKQERAERTLRRIITAAAEQFEQNGYRGTSLDDITRAAGVSKGAFYFHFASKDQVAMAVLGLAQGLFEDAVADSCEGGSPLQSLIDLSHELSELVRLEPPVRAAMRLHRERPEPVAQDFDHHALWYEAADRLLARAARQHELLDTLSGRASRALASTTLFSVEALSWADAPEGDSSRQLSELWELLLPAIAPPTLVGTFRTSAPDRCTDHPELAAQL